MKQPRRGYVLLMTLAVLVMAATLLVAVGRQAVSRSLAASLGEENLQRKWGTISCRTALLPHAEDILKQLETASHRPAPLVQATIRLGDQEFLLKLGDEQAKANINAMLMDHTVGDAEDQLRDATSGTGVINAIRLRPADDDTPIDPNTPISPLPLSLRAFGQVLTGIGPERLSGVVGASPIRSLTLWGNGAVNILRADRAAMRMAMWPTVSRVEIDRIISARNQLMALDPAARAAGAVAQPAKPTAQGGAVGYLMTQAQIDPKTANRLTVTDHSACHSLWMIVKDRHRVWYDFAVSDDSIAQRPVRDEFTW